MKVTHRIIGLSLPKILLTQTKEKIAESTILSFLLTGPWPSFASANIKPLVVPLPTTKKAMQAKKRNISFANVAFK
jgi:hypothetical protein